MIEKEFRRRQLKIFKLFLVVMGGIISITALIVDWLGFGKPGSFGSGQLLLLLIGFFLLLFGLVGRRALNFYKGLAVILLNTLALFVCLELGGIIIARSEILPSSEQSLFEKFQDLPFYSTQNWTETYWKETSLAEKYRYKPFVIWSQLPFVGETINIDSEGLRQTPGSDCRDNAYKVFTFGGSTMWGWGSPDWETIPAHLQTGLANQVEGPICVTNFGENGFVSTQGLIELISQLQVGRVPDAVIFYDGANDVYAVFESGQPGAHLRLGDTSANLEEREHPLLKWYKKSRQYSLLERLAGTLRFDRSPVNQISRNYQSLENNREELANSITQTYLNNYRIVSVLAQEYGFEYFFFWQPHLAIDEKSLTKEEEAMRLTMDQELVNLVQVVYEQVNRSAPDYENLWYIAKVFEGEDEQIWIDTWGHVTPEGNRLIAQEMLTIIIKDAMAEK